MMDNGTYKLLESLKYKGILSLQDYGESEDIITLEEVDEKGLEEGTVEKDQIPFVEMISEHINEKFVTVKYYLCNSEVPESRIQEEWLKKLFGDTESEYDVNFSETTGYLWTDQNLIIGGHNLAGELYEAAKKKKWIIIYFDIYDWEREK